MVEAVLGFFVLVLVVAPFAMWAAWRDECARPGLDPEDDYDYDPLIGRV